MKLDYLGAALIAGGVSTLLIWISLAGAQFAWGSATSLTLAGLGIAALVAAVIVELRVPEPVVPMELFRNRTVVLSVLGSIVLGLVMFGGSVFLGQYYQVARGYAPTEAGLLTLPLVGGLMIASTVSGQLISRYGRWKGFLVAGAILTTTGLSLLSTMDHTTSIPLLGVYLGVLGLGVGMSMQNLVLAVQNTVDVTEVGSASSLVAFLRSMGGTIGVTVLGIVLSHRVSSLLGVPASGASSGTSDLGQLDGAAAVAVRAAYGDAIGRVFLIAAIGSILTLVAVAFIKEVPLRTTVGRTPEAAPVDTASTEIAARTDDGHHPRHAAPADSDAAARGARHRTAAVAGGAHRPRRGRARRERPGRCPWPAGLVGGPAARGRVRPAADRRPARAASERRGRLPGVTGHDGRSARGVCRAAVGAVEERAARSSDRFRRTGRSSYACVQSRSGDDACAQYRFGIRPAPRAARPASTASRIARAMSSGSPARVTAVASRTASQPSSIACAASDAVPIPASSTTGTPACSTIMAMLCGLRMPSPVPIGAPSGITAAHPTCSSFRASTGSSFV